MANAISKYQDLIRSMWNERNEQKHRSEISKYYQRETNKIDTEIDEVYQELESVAPSKRLLTKG